MATEKQVDPRPAAPKSEPKAEAKPEPKPDFVVSVPFAYATAKSGEIRQLIKGDVVFADQYDKDSIDHLRSIEFLTEPE